LDPLLFLAYVNDIWRNIESTIRLFADDCIIYRKIMNDSDTKFADRPGQIGGMAGSKRDENKLRQKKSNKFHKSSCELTSKVLSWSPKRSGSKQLHIFRNNLTQRFRLG
jgi:hypothetical protein